MSRHHRTILNDRLGLQRGVSLIELMVALVVGLILLTGLIQVYLSTKQSYNAQEQLARMQESGRFAMDLITRDLRRAGFWGGNVDLTAITGSPGSQPPEHLCLSASNLWGFMVSWRVSGLDDDNTGYDCADAYINDTDILTVRYAGPNIFDGILEDDGLYLRSTMFLGRAMTGLSENDLLNQAPPDPTFSPAHLAPVVRQLVSHAYYIGDSGRTCPNGDVIPALRRVRLDPEFGLPVSEEVVSGVEQLQVRYLLNGAYQDASPTWADEWRRVTAVRVWLLVRGECREPGLVNDATYVMGNTPLDVNDDFRRQLYVSTVMLRNTAVR